MISPSRAVRACAVVTLLLFALPSPALSAAHPYNTGCSKLASGDLAGAEAAFESALRLNGKDTDALNNLAVVNIRQAEYDKAEQLLKRVLAYNSRYAGASANLGGSELLRDDYKASLLDSAKATRAPGTPEGLKVRAAAYHNLGVAYLKTDEPEKALDAFEASLKIAEDDATKFGVGLATCATGDYENGTGILEQIVGTLEDGPDKVDAERMLAAAYCDLGWELLQKEDRDGARQAFEKASRLRPKVEGDLGLDVLAAEGGDYAVALDGFKHLAASSPDAEVRKAAEENAARAVRLQDEASAPLKWGSLIAAGIAFVAHLLGLVRLARAVSAPSSARIPRIAVGVVGGLVLFPLLISQVMSPARSAGAVGAVLVGEALVLLYMWSMRTSPAYAA